MITFGLREVGGEIETRVETVFYAKLQTFIFQKQYTAYVAVESKDVFMQSYFVLVRVSPHCVAPTDRYC